jgi:hypothetical protein
LNSQTRARAGRCTASLNSIASPTDALQTLPDRRLRLPRRGISSRAGLAASPRANQDPKLLRTYLAIGARICSAPAWDREFGTIDFLTLVGSAHNLVLCAEPIPGAARGVSLRAAWRGVLLVASLLFCALRFQGMWFIAFVRGSRVTSQQRAEWMHFCGRMVLAALGIRARVEGQLPAGSNADRRQPPELPGHHDREPRRAVRLCGQAGDWELAVFWSRSSKMGGTIFVDRESRVSAWETAEEMTCAAREGCAGPALSRGHQHRRKRGHPLPLDALCARPLRDGSGRTPAAIFYEMHEARARSAISAGLGMRVSSAFAARAGRGWLHGCRFVSGPAEHLSGSPDSGLAQPRCCGGDAARERLPHHDSRRQRLSWGTLGFSRRCGSRSANYKLVDTEKLPLDSAVGYGLAAFSACSSSASKAAFGQLLPRKPDGRQRRQSEFGKVDIVSPITERSSGTRSPAM